MASIIIQVMPDGTNLLVVRGSDEKFYGVKVDEIKLAPPEEQRTGEEVV